MREELAAISITVSHEVLDRRTTQALVSEVTLAAAGTDRRLPPRVPYSTASPHTPHINNRFKYPSLAAGPISNINERNT